MSTDNSSRQPIRRTIAQLVEDQQTNNDILPLEGGNKVARRVQTTQERLLRDSFAPLNRIDSRYKVKPKEGDWAIEPDTCLYWLSMNTSNRAVTDARVLELAEDMVAGEWHNTGTPIIFYSADKGRTYTLANGQTRLWAGWLSGCAVEHTIRITDDVKVLEHIDDHKARTVGDLLSTHKFANFHMLASCAAMVRNYTEFDPPFNGAVTMHNSPKWRRGQILEYCQDNPAFVDTVAEGHRALPWVKKMMRSPSLACGLYYLTWAATSGNHSFHTQFWEQMETGVGLEANHPILRLRHILSQNLVGAKQYNPLTVAAMVVKTWNLLRAGRVRGRIAWSSHKERFPSVT